MDNPLIVLLPLATILGIIYLIILRGERNAKESLARIQSRGFMPTSKYDLSDVVIAIDLVTQRVAFVNLAIAIRPDNSPSYNARMTEIIPIKSISHITGGDAGSSLIEVLVTFSNPVDNTFNNEKILRIWVPAPQTSQVEKLLRDWPIQSAVTSFRYRPK